jgi:hypothetical protein
MQITIDKQEAESLGLNMVEFLYLRLRELGEDQNLDVGYLTRMGYLDKDLNLTEMFSNRNETFDLEAEFKKIYNLYPQKAENRILKSLSHKSLDYEYCKKKFDQYHRKNPDTYKLMLKGLENEIKLRKNGNSEKFQINIQSWFTQRTWEKYMDLEDFEENELQNTDII